MEANQILDHLIYVNYELAFDDIDRYFEKIGFHNATKEGSILSYVSNNSSDLNGISWCMINVDNAKIMNSNFRTTKEINLESVLQYAKTHHGFTFDEETEDNLIYSKEDLRMHIRTIKTPLSEFSKITRVFYLFDSLRKPVHVITMPPSPTT
ncbi:MAG: hypothetical protein V4663_04260 [Bacteroidota bacterium]